MTARDAQSQVPPHDAPDERADLERAWEELARRLVRDVPSDAPTHAVPPVGAVLAVHTPGGESLAVAGDRTLEPAAPMTPDTVHDLASVTKVAGTTVTVMRLVSEGLLALDRSVTSLLPAFAGGYKDDVTVRDLLEHRSGMAEWWPLYISAAGGPAPEAAYDVVDRLALRYAPRSGHHYSDLGFVQLGRIVSAVTGLPLPEAVRALVLDPLGVDLGYGPPAGAPVAASGPDDRVERAMLDSGTPYPVPFSSADFAGWRTGTIHGEVHDGNAFHALGGVSGHAGLFGTAGDLLRLATALAHAHEHTSIWSPAVVEEFVSTRHAVPTRSWNQALGFRRYPVRLGGRTIEVLGHTGFVGAAMAFVPGGDVAVALGTNRLLRGGPAVPLEPLLHQILRVALAPDLDAAGPRPPGGLRPSSPAPDLSRGTP